MVQRQAARRENSQFEEHDHQVCGTRFEVMSRHALVPLPFLGLSRFIIGPGQSGGQKLCQQASLVRTLFLLGATAAHAHPGDDPASSPATLGGVSSLRL